MAAEILRGETTSSKALDVFQLSHAVCALSFAMVALLTPWMFAYCTVAQTMPAVALDCCRWASPFITGFGLLAGISLTMRALERMKVCMMYVCAFSLELVLGGWVQLSGRWNVLMIVNFLPFLGLALGYWFFLTRCPEAFERLSVPRGAMKYDVLIRDAEVVGPVLGGRTSASKAMDFFVTCHAAFALLFAAVMAMRPDAFGVLSVTGELPAIALDNIRWGAPFVFGFGILAAMSLQMRAAERRKVAGMYTVALSMAVAVGCSIQLTGRWSTMHCLAPLGFALLAACYGMAFQLYPTTFVRTDQDTLAVVDTMGLESYVRLKK